jgi:hypothetical protein
MPNRHHPEGIPIPDNEGICPLLSFHDSPVFMHETAASSAEIDKAAAKSVTIN